MPTSVGRPGLSGADGNVGHRARLRERLLDGGADAFLDHELLEYVLGLALVRRDTKPLAKALLAEFGSYASVISADPQALSRVDGLGASAAAALKFIHASALRLLKASIVAQPVLANSGVLLDYLHAAHAHLMREQVRVLFLNSKNFLIRDEIVADGTINQATVHIREILRRSLELGAAGLILVHNHPSGDPAPSRDDIALTREIVAATGLLGIVVHDHIVIGRAGHVSLRALGHMA